MKPRPDRWDSDLDGDWAEQPGALVRSEDEEQDPNGCKTSPPGRRSTASKTRNKASNVSKTSATKRGSTNPRAKRATPQTVLVDRDDSRKSDENRSINDVVNDNSDDRQRSSTTTRKTKRSAPTQGSKAASARSPSTKQATLNFSQSNNGTGNRRAGATSLRRQEPVRICF